MSKRKTPETLTAMRRAAQLMGTPDQAGANLATRGPTREVDAGAELVQSVNGAGPIQRGSVSLPIDAIDFYEHNPRLSRNPRYDELRQSIEADGITNPITVTRRSVDAKYTPYGGGNTRLRIAKELHAAGDERFAQLRVIVKEWPGDAQVIGAHLAKNELRGEITFWEKAIGVEQYKFEFERESGKALSTSDLHQQLRSRGLNYGVKTLQNFAFVVEHLEPVGPWLQARAVDKIIKPQLSALYDLAGKLNRHAAADEALASVSGGEIFWGAR